MIRRSRFATLLILAAAVQTASAAVVTRSDDSKLTGALAGIENGQLSIVLEADDSTVAVPLDDITDISLTETPTTRPATRKSTTQAARPAATQTIAAANLPAIPATQPRTTASAPIDRRTWHFTLVDQSTVSFSPTAWADGRISGRINNSVAVDLPLTFVRQAWCGSTEQISAAQALGESAASDDVAYAARDKKVLAVHGVAVGVDDSALQFRYDDQVRKLPLQRLVGVAFAGPAAAPAAKGGPTQVLLLSSGDSIPGTLTQLDAHSACLTSAWGQQLMFTRHEAVRITTRNGRLTSLSDMTPSQVEQTPYFDRMLPWQIDHTLDGQPLRLSDGPIKRGIAMHARTVLTYALGGQFDRFRAKVGFEQPAGRLGNAILRVWGDGKPLFEKIDALGTDAPLDIDISIAGCSTLKLEVDFGKNQDVGDRVIWGNARLNRTSTP